MTPRGGGVQVSVIVPEYVERQLKQYCGEHNKTLRVALLECFKAAGFEIHDSDLVDRRLEAAQFRSAIYHKYKEMVEQMALDPNARKTEHSGAKNMSHDKRAPRAELKRASKKLRRRVDKASQKGQHNE